jgi:cytochrome c2
MSARRLGLAAVVGAAVTALTLAIVPAGEQERAPRAASAPGGRAVFAKLGCGSCHRFAAAGSTARLGPNLDRRLRHHDATSLRAVILDPPRYSMMPEDFGRRTTERELDALVDFLLEHRR